MLLPLNKSHRIIHARGDAVKITFLFSFDEKECGSMKTLFDCIVEKHSFIVGDTNDTHIFHIENICNTLREKTPISPMLCWNKTATLIFSVIQSIYVQNRTNISYSSDLSEMWADSRYIAAKQFIHDNSMRHLTVSEVSEHCHISPKQLNRIFQKESGQTISQYIQEQRIEMMKKQLANDDRPLYLISYELGFCDEFYFSRFFTKMTNMSPSQYRLQNKEQNND
jgi:AraC-like DNA-binding protein